MPSPPAPATPSTSDGWQLYHDGRVEDALAIFDGVLARDAHSYQARLGRGRCHRLLGAYPEALADFSLAHELRPTAARPLFERGAISILTHRYDDALADYEAGASLEPDYPGSASYFAELFLYTGRAGAALELSERASRDEPANLMHRINIAHAHLLLGDTRRATQAYTAIAGRSDPTRRSTAAVIALHDLALMRAAGIEPAGMREAEATLVTTAESR